MDGAHVRRDARLPDQRRLPRTARQGHGGTARRPHRQTRRIRLFRHALDVAHAAHRRRRSVGGHRPVAGLRPFDLLLPDYRRGPYYQDVGACLCPADDGGHLDDAAWRQMARRRHHSPLRIARNRRQPPSDHLLFPAGRRAVLRQRIHPCPAPPPPRRPAAPHGAVAARRPAGRGLQLRPPVVHGPPHGRHHARRFGTGGHGRNLPPRTRPGVRNGLELRPGRKLEPADSRLHGRRFGSHLRCRRRHGPGIAPLRPAGTGRATAPLLGRPALHCRPDLPGGRRPVSGAHGAAARLRPLPLVAARRKRANAPAGLGPPFRVVHPPDVRLPAALQ